MARPSYVGKKGWVASVTEKGVEWVPWWKAMAPGPTGSDRPFRGIKFATYGSREELEEAKRVGAEYASRRMDPLPPIVKRTPQQRIESLTKRLVDIWKENPRLAEAVLVEIQGEYWKVGTPVTIHALRAAASEALRDAERRRKV